MILTYKIEEKDTGKLLKDILKKKLYISTELMKKLKLKKLIYVNNIPTFVNYIVNENDIVKIDLNDYISTKEKLKFEDKFPLVDKPLNILYEDKYLLIVSKDTDMPIHPSTDNYDNTLANIVASYLKKQNIFHMHIITRLDRDTTGVCIFAKNEYIQELFARKKDSIAMKKEYIAIVNGILKKDHDIIEKNIDRMDGTIILREVVDNNKGYYAKTEYTVLNRNTKNNYTVIDITLHTGRTHQIRVHMLSEAHVLLGDTIYAEHYGIENINAFISRQALHAKRISFFHPITNEFISIDSPIPEDMLKLI